MVEASERNGHSKALAQGRQNWYVNSTREVIGVVISIAFKDASPMDTLYLDADVVCSSNPSKLVTSCTTCQGREVRFAVAFSFEYSTEVL